MMKKILLISDPETAKFDPFKKTWVSRHGKSFDTEFLARLHGCTHVYCRTCHTLTIKEKTSSNFECRHCYEHDHCISEAEPGLFV